MQTPLKPLSDADDLNIGASRSSQYESIRLLLQTDVWFGNAYEVGRPESPNISAKLLYLKFNCTGLNGSSCSGTAVARLSRFEFAGDPYAIFPVPEFGARFAY